MNQSEPPVGRGSNPDPDRPPFQDQPVQDQFGHDQFGHDQQQHDQQGGLQPGWDQPGQPGAYESPHWPGPGQPGPSRQWPGDPGHGYAAYGTGPYPGSMSGDHGGSGPVSGQVAGPPPGWVPVVPGKLPTQPADYLHLVRGPAYRWWKPLLVFLLCLIFALIAQLVLGFVAVIAVFATGGDMMTFLDGMSLTGPMDAITFGYVTASLIALIPSAMFASWIVHGIRPRFLSSVAGGIRWGWLLRCLMVTLPVFLVYMGVQFLVGWDYEPRPPQWIALLIIVVIGIPFQSAGEEYVFRGLLMQNIGSWFRNPIVALIASVIPSVVLFGFAHGSLDIWILCDLAIFAVAACVLIWRTGGMEAAIVLHATNNVLIMVSTILFGGWEAAFISTDSEGAPIAVLISLVVESVVVALVLWQAKRVGVQRLYQPVDTRTTPPVGATY